MITRKYRVIRITRDDVAPITPKQFGGTSAGKIFSDYVLKTSKDVIEYDESARDPCKFCLTGITGFAQYRFTIKTHEREVSRATSRLIREAELRVSQTRLITLVGEYHDTLIDEHSGCLEISEYVDGLWSSRRYHDVHVFIEYPVNLEFTQHNLQKFLNSTNMKKIYKITNVLFTKKFIHGVDERTTIARNKTNLYVLSEIYDGNYWVNVPVDFHVRNIQEIFTKLIDVVDSKLAQRFNLAPIHQTYLFQLLEQCRERCKEVLKIHDDYIMLQTKGNYKTLSDLIDNNEAFLNKKWKNNIVESVITAIDMLFEFGILVRLLDVSSSYRHVVVMVGHMHYNKLMGHLDKLSYITKLYQSKPDNGRVSICNSFLI